MYYKNKYQILNQNLTRFQHQQIDYYSLLKRMQKEQKVGDYKPSKYSKSLNNYTKNYIKWVNPFLNCISKSCHYGAKYPIFKVIKAISKIFLLNQIQIIFLAYLIKQTNWDIKEKLITYNSESIRDVVVYSNDQPEYKSLVLYLMVISYSVKFYLNTQTNEVLEQANKICPNFKAIFQNWAKKHANLTKRINPKMLNKVYQKLAEQSRRQEPDFNMIVDAIIQISPAYNPQKNDGKKKQFAQIKKQPIKKVKTDNQVIISSINGNIFNSVNNANNHNQNQGPSFSSSALYDIAAHGKNVCNQNAISSLNVFNKDKNFSLNKSLSIFGSSMMVPKYDFRDRQSQLEMCQSLILNLKQGQSQENIILQENDQNQASDHVPQTSIINLQKGVSITEKYWAETPQEKGKK